MSSSSRDLAGSNDFYLDSAYIDTQLVKQIGINRASKSIAVEIDSHLVLQTIHLDDFADKTIRPLKKQLEQILQINPKAKRLSIINSIITCVNRNIDRIKDSIAKEDNDQSTDDKGTEGRNAEILFQLATQDENIERLFRDQYGRPYAAVRLGGDHRLEIMQVNSSKFKYYLAKLFRENTEGKIIGKEAVNNTINVLAANAEFDSEIISLHVRVAWGKKENRAKEDCIYYDMVDAQRRIVEISKNGWRMINGSDPDIPIIFKRYNQTPQIGPDSNYTIDIFDQFLNLTNVTNPDHRHLLKVLIVSAFIPEIDHPILTTYGPQGAAKSFLLSLIKMLVDPSKPVLLTLLKNIPEFIQQVNHNYLAFYDNVKYIPYWLSDEICKAVTGIGHTKRELFTDDNDIIYEHRRCISINGINVALTEPDALDRSIFIELSEIGEITRREKEELLIEFERVRPKLLAYIFDIVVKALQIKRTLKLTRLPRMADFAKWGEAISRAMDYANFTFLEVYAENRNQQNIVAVNENIIGSIFVRFYYDYEIKNQVDPTFVGSPELLYTYIIDFAEANQINIKYQQFPKAPNILVKRPKTLKSNLREAFGITIEIERDSSNNSVVTVYRRKPSNQPSATHNLNQYYEIRIQQRHIQNQNFIIGQTPYINELASAPSEPPTLMQISTDSSTGGKESTEVTSLPCGVTDPTINDEEPNSENLLRENSYAASDNDEQKVDNEGFED